MNEPNPHPVAPKPSEPPPAQERASTKPDSSVSIPREAEKTKIKRQLYNLIDRVDKL